MSIDFLLRRGTAARACLSTLALGAVLVAGCGDDPVSNDDPKNPGGNTVTWTMPKQGSTFDFDLVLQDDERAPLGPAMTQSDTVVRTDMAFAGKTGVYAFVSDGDTTYVKHESNGDLSVYLYPDDIAFRGMPAQWITVPIASKSTGTDTLANVKNYYPEGSTIDVPMRLTGTFESQADGQITIGGQTHTTKRTRWTVTRTEGSMLYRIYVDWAVAPSLGYMASNDFLSEGWSGFGIDVPGGGFVLTLKGVSLK